MSARLSSIRLCIHRADLVRDDACAEGVQLFDRIAAEGASAAVLEFQWSPLAAVWLAVVARDYMPWLRERSYVPSSADLSSADLRSADLRSANLSGADLSSANLRSADLRSANLRSADLRNANLRSANLSSAYLYGADLSGADLSSADLRSAYLTFASRSIDDDPIAGWIVKNGRLEKVLS